MVLAKTQTLVWTRFASYKQSFYLLVVLVLLMTIPSLSFASVSARLDRNTIYSGDTVILQITATDGNKSSQPDLDPLREKFEIIGTSNSTQIQIMNGQRTDKRIWQIELSPLSTGSLKIPALAIGNSKTSALTLEVKEQPAAQNAQAGQDVLIQTEISPTPGSSYVQQQFLYTVRLFYKVPLVEGKLSEPKIDNAVIERLGDDIQYNTTLNGDKYQVIERRYAIFPERSGLLTIKPVIFSGRIQTNSRRYSSSGHLDSMMQQMLNQRGFNDSFFSNSPFGDPGKRVRIKSKTDTLQIKPRPDSYSGQHWLPTEKFSLDDSWETTPPVIHAGEPVTRTITLEAKGLEASQLPDLQKPGSETLHVYAEQPKLTNRTDGNWIYGRSEQRLTYVASQAGKIHIPATQVTWWDPTQHKQRETTLPARDLTVLPGGNTTQAKNPDKQTSTNAMPFKKTSQSSQDITEKMPADSSEQVIENYWRYWLPAAGIFILLLISAYLLLRKRSIIKRESAANTQNQNNEYTKISQHSAEENLQYIHSKLRTACEQSQPEKAAQSLLEWACIIWPQQPPRNLRSLAQQVDKHKDVIIELESVLYSAHKQDWHGHKLWDAYKDGFLKINDKNNTHHDVNKTPALYPDWKQYHN